MCKVTVTTATGSYSLNIEPSANFTQCIPPAAIAALQAFAASFMSCMANPPKGEEYKPGNRPRCAVETTAAS